jgi:hypothetical protein
MSQSKQPWLIRYHYDPLDQMTSPSEKLFNWARRILSESTDKSSPIRKSEIRSQNAAHTQLSNNLNACGIQPAPTGYAVSVRNF